MRGGSGTLFASQSAAGGSRLSLIGDLGYSQLEQEEGADPLDVESGWVRAGLEWARNSVLSRDRLFGQSLALTYRQDFGDAQEGGGVELEGGLDMEFPYLGLRLDLKARTLLAHEEEIDDWGISGGFVWKSARRHGLSVTLQPQWGSMASAKRRLWEGGLGAAPDAASRHSMQLEYGLPVMSGQELLRMFARGDLLGGSETLGLGAALELSEALDLGYEMTLSGGAPETDEGAHRAYIRFRSRF